jgi:hypothetical protein
MYRIPKSTCGQGRKWCEPKICDAKDTTEFTSAADPDPDPQHWNLLCQNLVLKVVFNIFDSIRAQLIHFPRNDENYDCQVLHFEAVLRIQDVYPGSGSTTM